MKQPQVGNSGNRYGLNDSVRASVRAVVFVVVLVLLCVLTGLLLVRVGLGHGG